MKSKKNKPNRWAYGFAALGLILGFVLTIMFVYQTISNIPGALEERIDIDKLTQVIVPGSTDITFAKPGAYAVYYEYRSIVNGLKYETSEQPLLLECTLTSKKAGVKVNAVPDYVEDNTYSTKDQDRVGVLIMSISIDDPGIYAFACQYQGSRTQPEIVVSVGPNFMWEFFNIFVKLGGSILSGMAFLSVAVLVSIIVVLIVTVRHSKFN